MRTVVLAACGLVAFGGPVAGQPPQPAKAGELEPFPVARELKLDSNQSTSMALSPDGRVLAVVDGVCVRFWNPRTGKPAATPWKLESDPRIIGLAIYLAFVDDKTIAMSRNRNDISLREYPSGRELHAIDLGQTVRSDGWAVAPGLLVCAGVHNGQHVVRLFTGPEWQESWRAVVGTFPRAFAFSPDRSELAIGAGGSLQIRSVEDGKLLRAADENQFPFRDVRNLRELAYSPDGRTIAFWSSAPPRPRQPFAPGQRPESGISLLDAKFVSHRIIPWDGPGAPIGYAFSADGKTLIVPCFQNSVRLYEIQTGKLRHVGAIPTQTNRFAVSPDGKWFISASAGRVVVADWRAAGSGVPPVREPAALWADLASADGAKGYRAVVELGATPAEAVKLIGANLKPAAVPGGAAVKALIADLAADDFATREAAQKELAGLAELVEPELRAAAKSDSPERRDRASEVLKALSRGDHPEQLRRLRSVEVLEYLGTPAARDALQALAAGAPSARLTQDAKSALERLQARDPKP